MVRHTFAKEEHLRSKKLISLLMTKGKSFPVKARNSKAATGEAELFPFRLVWLETELPSVFPAQVMFSVPKKKFKSAVQRNRIRRLMREAYRKNKHFLYESLKKSRKKLAMAFIYTSRAETEYDLLEEKIFVSLQYLSAM